MLKAQEPEKGESFKTVAALVGLNRRPFHVRRRVRLPFSLFKAARIGSRSKLAEKAEQSELQTFSISALSMGGNRREGTNKQLTRLMIG